VGAQADPRSESGLQLADATKRRM